MTDPVTIEQAIADLADAWRVARRFRHPASAPTTWAPGAPARSSKGDPPPVDALHPLKDERLHVLAQRELRAWSFQIGRRHDAGPPAEEWPEDPPEAWPELTAIRDGLARFVGHPSWGSHPVAKRMTGLFAPSFSSNPDLADLENLPEAPAERAAMLTASAFTARQERDRLGSMLEGARADDARRIGLRVETNTEHYARAVAMLPAAFGAWRPTVTDAHGYAVRPEVPAFPTVVATPQPVVWPALGRA